MPRESQTRQYRVAALLGREAFGASAVVCRVGWVGVLRSAVMYRDMANSRPADITYSWSGARMIFVASLNRTPTLLSDSW